MDAVDDRKNCQICTLEVAKYVCPRCGIPYCSLKCYKDERKHVKCSESFYKDCVMEGIRTQEVKDPEGAKKMTQALQRFHQEYDDRQDGLDDDEEDFEEGPLDSDDDEPLEKRMQGIDLDNADEIWLHLTEEERVQFKKFAQDVDVQDIVPEWSPWWTIKSVRTLVQEITSGELNQNSKNNKSHPDILDPIPLMSSLTKIKPNDHVKIGLTNVIASYVWTSRLYNGEFVTHENPGEVAAAFVSLSSFLGKDLILTSFEHALADVSMNACRSPELFDGGPSLQASLNKDVLTILTSPVESTGKPIPKTYILSALSECYKLLTQAATLQKSKSKHTISPIPIKKTAEIRKTPQSETWFPKRKSKKLVEEIEEDESPSGSSVQEVPDNIETVNTTTKVNESETVSFEKVFVNPRSFHIEPKVLTKAKRKIHYLLAFANEYDVL